MLLFSFCTSPSRKPAADKNQMKITIEIVPEDLEKKWYTLVWEDTLGQHADYTRNRPFEMWCVIKSKQGDTLGYYKGMSTSFNFCNFQTTDSLITLYFRTGLTLDFNFDDKSQDEIKRIYDTYQPVAYKPVEVNIYHSLRKKTTLILESDFKIVKP